MTDTGQTNVPVHGRGTFANRFRGWILIALAAGVICGAVAFVISAFVVPPAYTATATLQVQPGINASNYAPQDPRYANELSQTWAAIGQMKSLTRPAYDSATGTTDSAGQHRIISSQSPSTTCQATTITQLFSCSVTASSADFAAHAVNALSQAIVQKQQTWSPEQIWTINIVNPASPPSSPSSPHSTLNALVAFALVALVVLGFGWIESREPGGVLRLARGF